MRTLVTTLMLILSVAAFAAPEWQLYRSDEGRFSVMLPDQPMRSRQALRTDKAATNNVVAVKTEKGALMVSYVDSETFDDDRSKIDTILNNTCVGAASNAGASNPRIVSAIRNGFVGRIVQFKGRDGTSYRGLVFLAGTRLYQVYASGEEAWVSGNDVDRFLDSFRMWK
jgi:hypothetical protein